MTATQPNERRSPLYVTAKARRRATWWLAAILGSLALLAAIPAAGRAEESNANNYSCLGQIGAGPPVAGSEEQQVQYSFYCDGPITGYQLQSQIPLTGVSSPPLVANRGGGPTTETFSCSGEVPGYALNCVGLAKEGYEHITGEFSIGTKLCDEPRVDPLLTVTYAYLEKSVVTQAISGPFDLGRPEHCPPDAYSGGTRLDPKPVVHKKKHSKSKGKGKGKKGKASKRKGKSSEK
ncbi:MAG TPA: hypothetical protein VEJ23_00985 [Solirubrobacteraceae bacterium]|nr:hypothetical protein [Solirubrobacteraceae bacterium]